MKENLSSNLEPISAKNRLQELFVIPKPSKNQREELMNLQIEAIKRDERPQTPRHWARTYKKRWQSKVWSKWLKHQNYDQATLNIKEGAKRRTNPVAPPNTRRSIS